MPEDKDKGAPGLEPGDYDLEQVFARTADAVLGAQRKLDAEFLRPYHYTDELPHAGRFFSVPRTSIELVFGLEIDDEQRVMLIRKGTARRLLHTHRLRFSLVALPESPAPPLLPPGGAQPSFFLTAPRFLLTPADEDALARGLLSALVFADAKKWKWFITKPPAEKMFTDERVKIQLALQKPDAETGMVFFRLDALQEDPKAPTAYLIVRVTGKEHNDSLFLFTPEAQPGTPPLDIYSLEGDGTKAIRYGPLHRLGLTLRRWLRGEMASASVSYPEGLPFRYGLEYLQPLAEGMRRGYFNGLARLAGQDGGPAGIWYDFAEVAAELSYSVEYEQSKAPRFSFDVRTAVDKQPTGDDGSYRLIESSALINVVREGEVPRVRIELLTPEFVLSGDALAAFLALVDNSIDEIVLKFAADANEAARYRSFLLAEGYRRGAVVLLAYRGQTPKEEFLAIWPGLSKAGAARDFVFTAKRRGDGLRVGDPVMRLDEDVESVRLSAPEGATADSDITGEQYQPFHNFFHAVRIWRARMLAP